MANRLRVISALTLVSTLALVLATPSPSDAVTSGMNGRVAFVSDRDGTRQIYAMRGDGTGVIQLTFPPGNNYDPNFSGDGSKIAFISDRDGAPDMYWMYSDGTGQTRITTDLGATIESHPYWAPNNSAIVFAGLKGTDSDIYKVKPNGNQLVDLTPDPASYDADPSWSPGGTLMAFDRTVGASTDIYTMVNDGTNVTPLTTSGKDSNPSWAPDNKNLTYESAKDNPVPGPVVFTTTRNRPIGLAVTSSKVLFMEWNSDNIKQIDANGSISTFASLPPTGRKVERYLAISPGLGGFPRDDVYATVGQDIWQVSPDGLTQSLCAHIASLQNGETGITFDTVGTFGFNMILTDRTGPVWTLPWNSQTGSCGTPTRLLNVGFQIEGPLVAPLSFIPYPGWLLLGNEATNGNGVIYAVDPTSHAVTTIPDPNAILDSPEAAIQIPSTACNLPGTNGAYFIAMEDSKEILMFDASNFTNVSNDILAPSELHPDTKGIALLASNGSSIDISNFWPTLPGTADLEGSAFAPCGSGSPKQAHDATVAGPHEIYKINTVNPVPMRLTNNGTVDDINPAYSPDGLNIVFQSDRDNPGVNYEIYKMLAADGSGQTNISNNLSANDTTPDWESVQAVVTVDNFAFTPSTVKPKQGGAVLWDYFSEHTATDNTGMGLFDSGTREAGQSYTFVFPGAGSYAVYCTIHPTMTMTVKVPTTAAPKTGNLTTQFTITWAIVAPTSPYVFDIQILRPGATDWVDWRTGMTQTQSAFFADGGTGTYSFKTRLRNTSNGFASDYSAPVSITVNP